LLLPIPLPTLLNDGGVHRLKRAAEDDERRRTLAPIVVLNEFGLLQPLDQIAEVILG